MDFDNKSKNFLSCRVFKTQNIILAKSGLEALLQQQLQRHEGCAVKQAVEKSYSSQ